MHDEHADENVAQLAKLIQGFRVAMLTTLAEDGTLRSRPMAVQTVPFDGVFWFFTRMDTTKVEEIHRDDRVNLTFMDAGAQRFISVSGEAEVVPDRRRMEALWDGEFAAWFPRGLADPNLALLRVVPEHAQFWDKETSTLVQLVGFVKAMAVTDPNRPGDQERMDFESEEE